MGYVVMAERDEHREELEQIVKGPLPPGWHELTEEEFVKGSFRIYAPIALGYMQFQGHDDNDEVPRDCRIFLMHDHTGFGMTCDYWAEKVRYFAFGCNGGKHAYKETSNNMGRCYHTFTCEECGHKTAYDSSG